MGQSGLGSGAPLPQIQPRSLIADPRKFSEYGLVPDHPGGKDRVVLNRLGFRSRSADDANALVSTYVAQARDALAAGDYMLGRRDEYGQRLVVVIGLGGTRLRSVWLLRPNGVCSLVTPFSGFARGYG